MKYRKKLVKLLAVVLLLSSMVSTAMGANVSLSSPATAIKSITMKIGGKNVTKKTYDLQKGKTATVKVAVNPSKALKSRTFSSDKKSVAVVSKTGKITAKGTGKARITVKVKGKNGKTKSTYVTIRVKKPAVHVHQWDNGTITQTATCITEGVKTYKCKNCKETRTETIPATGIHQWDAGTITQAATCTVDGVKTYQCLNCTETKIETIPATGIHQWDAGTITRAATCTVDGVKTYQCKNCTETKTETISASHDKSNGVKCTKCGTYFISTQAIGKEYRDQMGLTVRLNSFTVTEKEGYFQYSIDYTLKNDVPDTAVGEGSFKLFFTGDEGENQYGGFNDLYYGDSVNRQYTWKVLKSKTVLVLEYNNEPIDAGLNGAFFRKVPAADSLHWKTEDAIRQ